MDNTYLIILAALVVVSFGAFIGYFLYRSAKRNRYNERVQNFIADSERRIVNIDDPQTPTLSMRELEGGFLERTIYAWIKNLFNYLDRFTPQKTINELNKKLAIMGNPYNFRALQFLSLRIVSGIVGIIIALLLFQFAPAGRRVFLPALLVFLFSILLPSLWLYSGVKKAKNEISKGLPYALDMLSVCASAGLVFDQSLQRVSEQWKTKLGLEFRRVVQEMEVGVPRVDALKNMADRLEVSELSSFIAVIVQADRLGMQIADVLHNQAEQMRILRQFRAKEIANRLPARMMVPLAFCVLPALIGVILGPMLPQFFSMIGGL